MAKNGVYSCSFQESAIFNPYFQTIAEKLFIMYLWYSGDGGPGDAVALQNGDGSLRAAGMTFRDFVKAKYP